VPERKTRHGAPWEVTVVPAGTPGEAALAAERARRLVAGWQRAGTVGADCGLFQGTVAGGAEGGAATVSAGDGVVPS
jgi:hypothetical protein